MLEGNDSCTNGKIPVDNSNTASIAPHDQNATTRRTVDPIVTLLQPDSSTTNTTGNNNHNNNRHVTAVCFLHPNHRHLVTRTPVATTTTEHNITLNGHTDDGHDSDNDSDWDDKNDSSSSSSFLSLQCASLVQQQQPHQPQRANIVSSSYSSSSSNADTHDLAGRLLATGDTSGACYIWDLQRRHVIDSISVVAKNDRRKGPVLTIRRLSDCDTDTVSTTTTTTTDHRFFYQTRDVEGTISLHDINVSPTILQRMSCHSQSFCSAASCHGNSNLIVMPCSEHSHVMVRDWRMSSSDHPVAYFHGGTGMIVRTTGDDSDDNDDEENEATYIDNLTNKKYGMVTSLAMSTCTNQARTLIACGMENGSVVYHDLSMLSSSSRTNCGAPKACCSISLSATEPILALDMVPSPFLHKNIGNHVSSSFVTIAGIAGNEEDLLELPVNDRGRIAVLKTSSQNDESILQVRLRSRISTTDTVMASIGSTLGSSQSIRAKPGIGQCRFRPDGRLFVVGGWDKRVRIYDRNIKGPTVNQPLAILRGHAESVNAVDWSYDSVNSGLIATGSSDGKVYVWRCFPSKSASPSTKVEE